MSAIKLEVFKDNDITDAHVTATSQLFSANYGIWGPLAEEKMGPFATQGRRICMKPRLARAECLPSTSHNTLVSATWNGQLIGHVLASRWAVEGTRVCWITQLCVDKAHRRQGLATQLLRKVREGEPDDIYGILSSHPCAIMAALRAFGDGLEGVDHAVARERAREVMAASPVGYVRKAVLRGSVFENEPAEGTVSCADTGFFVDHAEPLEMLAGIAAGGRAWRHGRLPEGHEFLALVEASYGEEA